MENHQKQDQNQLRDQNPLQDLQFRTSLANPFEDLLYRSRRREIYVLLYVQVVDIGGSFVEVEMGSKWRKAKLALGMKMCLYVPRTLEDSPAPAQTSAGRFSDAVSLSSTPHRRSDCRLDMPTTPVPSSSGLRLPKHSSKSSKVSLIFLKYNVTLFC